MILDDIVDLLTITEVRAIIAHMRRGGTAAAAAAPTTLTDLFANLSLI